MEKVKRMKITVQGVDNTGTQIVECQTLKQANNYIEQYGKLYDKLGIVLSRVSEKLPSIFRSDENGNYILIIKGA